MGRVKVNKPRRQRSKIQVPTGDFLAMRPKVITKDKYGNDQVEYLPMVLVPSFGSMRNTVRKLMRKKK